MLVGFIHSVGTRRALPGAALLLLALPNTRAHAFSDPHGYTNPAEMGGGGGRWFTGSPADGYGCNVCHEGGRPADLIVNGLPTAGYVPGTAYQVSLTWPAALEHFALIAEFSDERRQGAGALALPQPIAMSLAERCSAEQGGFPAAQLNDGDAGRKLVSVIDCGAKSVRFQWTAPANVAGPIWFNAGFVASNADAHASGDGVTLVREPLVLAGSGLLRRDIARGCSVGLLPDTSRPSLWPAWLFAIGLWRGRKRARTRTRECKEAA